MARRGGRVLLLAVVLAACRRAPAKDATDDAAIRKRLGQKSTAVLMQEVAKADFTPPADGHLTEPEIRSYLKLEERSRRIRAVATQGAAPELGATADLRAAQELGLNPKEMTWVRDRVREARTARRTERLTQRIAESRRLYVQRLRDEAARTADPQQKQALDRQITDFGRAPRTSGPAAAAPWVGWNAEMLGRYEPMPGKS